MHEGIKSRLQAGAGCACIMPDRKRRLHVGARRHSRHDDEVECASECATSSGDKLDLAALEESAVGLVRKASGLNFPPQSRGLDDGEFIPDGGSFGT